MAATSDFNPRSLVPGIGPGEGIRDILAKTRQKYALVILDAYFLLTTLGAGASWSSAAIYLKLSQDPTLNPGLILPVAAVYQVGNVLGGTGGTASGDRIINWSQKDFGEKLAGSVWAPRYTGVRLVEVGGVNVSGQLHLDYTAIEIDWEDWFVRWDYLDNVTDNEVQY